MLRYKACRNSIVTLELLDNTKTNENRKDVVDDRYAKFRCDRAIVIDIINVKTGKTMKADVSIYDDSFYYILDGVVKTRFNENNKVCDEGIHYFKNREAAASWYMMINRDWIDDGKIIAWHGNGQKKHEGTYKNGVEHGKWIWWYKSGKQKYVKTYKDGILQEMIGWINGERIVQTYKDGELVKK